MELFTAENLIALLALTSLEIVLGIDNVVFLAILVDRLDPQLQRKARITGLSLAMVFRILLLLGIKWIMRLTTPLFTVLNQTFSGKSLILLLGGLFLIAKATWEIHHSFEEGGQQDLPRAGAASFIGVIVQVILIDMVFSLDSVITAVGLAKDLWVMIAAIVVAIVIMMVFAGVIANFISHHPTLKMLALAFLILVGVMLVADGFGRHIERGYIYFAMAFSLTVEVLNIRVRTKRQAQG